MNFATKLGIGVGCVFLGLLSSYVSVPAGHVGIVLQFGAVKGTFNEGMNWRIPMIQRVQVVEVRTQKEESKAAAASKDLQTVSTKVAINFRIDPTTIQDLYKRVGLGYKTRVIEPATQESVKAVVANYTAEELIRKRSVVKAELDNLLVTRLKQYGLIIEPNGVSLTNFDFSAEFNKAIENKQVAQQSAEKQKYVLQQATLEADALIAIAKGKAEAARIEAQALANQGGAKVLFKQWIDKWDGKLPQVVTDANSSLLLDMKGLANNQ